MTLPLLSPTLFFQIVLALIASLQYFTHAFVLGGSSGVLGEPVNSTLFITLYIWQVAFTYTQMGYACAMSVVLFVLILLLTLLLFGSQRFWVAFAIVLPVALIFLLAQRYMIRGVILSGIKG